MGKKGKIALAGSIAFLLVLGIEFLYDIRSGNSLFSNSVTAFLIGGMAAYVGFRCIEIRWDLRSFLVSGLASILFSACMCMGHSLNYVETIWMKETFLGMACIWPFLTLVLRSGVLWLEKKRWDSDAEISRKGFWLYSGVLLLLWLPTFLASWPGVYGYDSEFQLNQFFCGDFNSHHPVLHTILVGVTMKLGLLLAGSPQAGAAVYTIVQMLIMAGILGFVVCKIQRKGAPRWFVYGMLGFYGLHPANSLMVISSTKDILFSGIMILLVLLLLDMMEAPEAFWKSRGKITELVILFLLAMALRNNAFHMLLLFAPFFVWACWKQWKKAVIVLGGCLVLHAGVTGPGYDMIGVAKGDPREMYSALMQSAARAYNLVNLDLTEEEKDGFYSVIAKEGLESYLPRFADPVKAYFDGEKFTEDPSEFMSAWISVGKRHTKIYVDSFLSNTLGYWYPGAMLPNNSGNHYLEYWANGNSEDLKVEIRSLIPGLFRLYERIGNEAEHQNVPVISFLFPIGTFVWILGAACFVLVYRKQYGMLIPVLPLLLYLATLFLGPVVALRYAYPIVVSTPVVLSMIMKKEKQHG